MKIKRVWAMPSSLTFTIKPIRSLVKWHLNNSKVSVDPFARNNRWATFTNDLNEKTQAEVHLEADVFLQSLLDKDVRADLVLFDPPYSRRQIMECYEGIGKEFKNQDSQDFSLNWKKERELIDKLLLPNGIVISCGWHSNGMQQSGNYEIEQILLVAHSGAHNDTIVTVERKIVGNNGELFS